MLKYERIKKKIENEAKFISLENRDYDIVYNSKFAKKCMIIGA